MRKETMPVAICAAAAHQVNRAWCLAHGDTTQPHWSEAPAWQRESAIAGARAALRDPRPEASHERWLEHKKAEGWVYGEVKDPERKTHPCMVPYARLPTEQQMKDELFVTTVREVGALLGILPEQGEVGQ